MPQSKGSHITNFLTWHLTWSSWVLPAEGSVSLWKLQAGAKLARRGGFLVLRDEFPRLKHLGAVSGVCFLERVPSDTQDPTPEVWTRFQDTGILS